MFSQVNVSLEKSQGGLGIGLLLVKRLVEMHGGHIVAQSEGLGKGSEFVVHLPVLVQRPLSQVVKVDSERNSASLRILVVDDNHDVAYTLATLLTLEGHVSRTIHTGEDAIVEALEFRPDIILLDIGLPKMNGYEVCRHIRSQPGGQEVKIIAQSGWGSPDDKRKSAEAGFDHHLVKPFVLEELMRLLRDSE